jgi:hypothetical protein
VWNELLCFALDACGLGGGGGGAGGDDDGGGGKQPASLQVSLRHHSMTIFQHDSVIAETQPIALPTPQALAAKGARARAAAHDGCDV